MTKDQRGGRTGRAIHIPGPALFLIDAAAWTVGVAAAMAFRFDLRLSTWSAWHPEVMALIGVLSLLAIGTVKGLYGGRWRRGSLDEGLALSQTVLATVLVAVVANEFLPGSRIVPVSVALAAGPVARAAPDSSNA